MKSKIFKQVSIFYMKQFRICTIEKKNTYLCMVFVLLTVKRNQHNQNKKKNKPWLGSHKKLLIWKMREEMNSHWSSTSLNIGKPLLYTLCFFFHNNTWTTKIINFEKKVVFFKHLSFQVLNMLNQERLSDLLNRSTTRNFS